MNFPDCSMCVNEVLQDGILISIFRKIIDHSECIRIEIIDFEYST